jgi:hypothetical protein
MDALELGDFIVYYSRGFDLCLVSIVEQLLTTNDESFLIFFVPLLNEQRLYLMFLPIYS